MNTLIYTSCLGLFCMLAEILNLRKLLIPAILAGLALIFYVNYQDWNAQLAPFYNDMLRVDNFSVAFSGLAIVISAFIFTLALDFYRTEEAHLSDYLAILVFVLCGALIMFSFSNLAMLFLGIEILSISLYIMAGSRRFEVRSNEAGFKYFLMGAFASGFLLFGIALIYGSSGSFHLAAIAEYVNQGNVSPLFYAGMMMMLLALLFKVSAVPFHFWSPDVYEGSPALITAMMSTLVKVAAFGAFYRLFASCFTGTMESASLTLAIVTAATIIIGNVVALSQDNFKRLLAYSGIANAGYIMLGIISLRHHTASAVWFYLAAYSFATIGAFAVALMVFKSRKSESISAFNGLGKTNPLLAAALSMCMLSLAGIPPFAGFLAKYNIFSEAIAARETTLTFIGILASAVGVYYYFKVILAMYTREGDSNEVETNMPAIVVVTLCLALSLLMGLCPGSFLHLI